MKNILNFCLDSFSKTISDISLILANAATGTISFWSMYEPEMPAALKPQGDDFEKDE